MFITFCNVNLRYKEEGEPSCCFILKTDIMLQYVINLSMIWLSCLLVYELLLRKMSFHRYNRFYLLITMLAGVLLPLINFNSILPDTTLTLPEPTSQLYDIKQAIQVHPAIKADIPQSVPFDIEQAIWWVYLAGIAVSIIILLREAFLLFALYARGTKSKDGSYTIVATGKNHSPFSFFNVIFVNAKSLYSAEEWALLMKHEQEHGRQLHSLDNLLLLIARTAFWFHPLSYVYYKKLRMVHEYQADDAAAVNIRDYGTFLLEQSMLQRSPVLAHSFNYSPVKTRIAMLTGIKTKRSQLFKYGIVVPLSFILVLFCTESSISRSFDKPGHKVNFSGNEIVFGEFRVIPADYMQTVEQQKSMFMTPSLPDSMLVRNRSTGEMEMKPMPVDIMPVNLNGKPILGNEPQYLHTGSNTRYTTPVFITGRGNMYEYLFAQLKTELDKLEDGGYVLNIDRMVVDDKGDLAYYENKGIELLKYPVDNPTALKEDNRKAIHTKLNDMLDKSVKFKPAQQDGKPVNVRLSLPMYEIVVKNHKAQLVERKGC